MAICALDSGMEHIASPSDTEIGTNRALQIGLLGKIGKPIRHVKPINRRESLLQYRHRLFEFDTIDF